MWNVDLYEQFSTERLGPSMDLVAKLDFDPFAILDVGCGSGMSTWCLRQKFPYAKIKGVDKSEEMLEKARKLPISVDFFQKDCSKDLQTMGMFDLVFSNAFLQWLDDQEAFVRDIRSNMNPGAIFALQIPLFGLTNASKLVLDTVEKHYKEQCKDVFMFHDYSVQGYYDMFSRYYNDIDIWETTYIHKFDSSERIIDFIQGTALIPYKAVLTADEYEAFIKELKEEITKVYPASENGTVLFPFARLFVIAKDPK